MFHPRFRRSVALVLIVISCTPSAGAVALAQANDPQTDWGILLGALLAATEAPDGQAPPVWITQSKVESFLARHAERHRSALRGLERAQAGSLRSADAVRQFMDDMARRSTAIAATELSATGLPTGLADEISVHSSRPFLREMERALSQRLQWNQFASGAIAASVAKATQSSVLALLRSDVDADALSRAISEVSPASRNVVASISPQATMPRSLQADIANLLSPDAQMLLQGAYAADRKRLTDEIRSTLANIGHSKITEELRHRMRIDAKTALDTVSASESFRQAEAALESSIQTGAKTLDNLNTQSKVLQTKWQESVDDVKRMTQPDQLRAAVERSTGLFDQYQRVRQIIDGGLSDKSQWRSTVAGVLSNAIGNSDLATAVNQLNTVGDASSTFAAKGQAALGFATKIFPQLQPLQSAFGQFAPFISQAAPLLALSGVGAPLAMALGGFGVGGGGPDGATMAALSAINAKLDTIIQQLNRIEETIRRQHLEEMAALEAIKFDLQRVKEIVNETQLAPVISGCVNAVDPDYSGSSEQLFRDCAFGMSKIARQTPLRSMLIEYSLRTAGADTSDKQWQRIQQIHAAAFKSTRQNCGLLLGGARRLADLQRADSKDTLSNDACDDIANISLLYNSAVVTALANADVRAARRVTGVWDNEFTQNSLGRWRAHLRRLNIAVGQQAALSGGLTASTLAEVFRSKGAFDENQKQLMDSFPSTAENGLRLWLWQAFGDRPTDQANYAVAYFSCDAWLILPVSGIDRKTARLQWPGNKPPTGCASSPGATIDENEVRSSIRWCAQVDGAGCIPLPDPLELQSGDARLTGMLQAPLQQRQDLLETIELAKLARLDSRTFPRQRLIEALTVMWIARQRATNGVRPA
jgi:hypothetical protein